MLYQSCKFAKKVPKVIEIQDDFGIYFLLISYKVYYNNVIAIL